MRGSILRGVLGVCLFAWMPMAAAAERPTFNKHTADPRPDILPYWLTNWHAEYRQIYNRPRFWGGWLAHTVEPSSQEAMVWCEASRAGLYHPKHQPPMYKQYYFPKPWEVLDTGPRPDRRVEQAAAPARLPDDDVRSSPLAEESTGVVRPAVDFSPEQ